MVSCSPALEKIWVVTQASIIYMTVVLLVIDIWVLSCDHFGAKVSVLVDVIVKVHAGI